MTDADLVGRWSRDLGYEDDLSLDVQVLFRHDRSGLVTASDEKIEFTWSLGAQSQLRITVGDHRQGPHQLKISVTDLPKGRFAVLSTDPPLLPFGLRQLTKLPASHSSAV